MPRALALLLAGALAGRGAPAPAQEPSEERIQAAWSFLLPSEQRDAAEWLRQEVAALDTFQISLVRRALALEPTDPGFWPEAAPPPVFDPAVHAPAAKGGRRLLPAGDPAVARAQRELLGEPDPRRLRSAWAYDWASGEIVRIADPAEPERIFANALLGYPPDLDRARVLVLRALDGGAERPALAAFAHAYADRGGRVFPGITLYDAWSSGRTIEMPDADTLGIVHDVLGEWQRWKAPVPARAHGALYGRIGELFLAARRYRGLREALADAFAIAAPPLGEYGPSTARFHALWERAAATPATLAETLPDAAGWQDFLAGLVREVAADQALAQRGLERQRTLAANGALVRATLLRVLEEYGAFARTRRPDPPPPPAPPGKEGGGGGISP
ncbi:MAG: hypothetical protein AB1726_18550 [Planctomycetota bacterium]